MAGHFGEGAVFPEVPKREGFKVPQNVYAPWMGYFSGCEN
jgi:hypothetical protein